MRQVTAENVRPNMVIRHSDGTTLRVLSNVKQENARHTLHCLDQMAREVTLADVNPTLYYDVPVEPGDTVELLKEGLDRVLNGAVGMRFGVDSVTNGLMGPVAHVRDYRYTGNGVGYQIWSIAADGYKVLA